MTENQNVTVVPMITSPKHGAYEWYGHQFESTVELRGRFRHQRHTCRFTVTYFDETTETRREYQGPIVKGEYAFMTAQASVISSHPIALPEVIDVADGDLISILGKTFRIQDDKALHDPRLVRVED
ncbi:hypothetical protein [Nocardia testacea]|uniref:hypothetical protein n=1 Tax=Nocardia testacea TaxID=248551 RepID=UPI0002FC3D7C|nr:hypothetical protein [Nocardia testacea]